MKNSSDTIGNRNRDLQTCSGVPQPTALPRATVLLVVVGPDRPRPTALLQPLSDGKPEATTAVVVAPDDGHEDARNMLSCIYTTSNKPEKLLHLVC